MTKRLFKFPYSQFTVLNETILKFKWNQLDKRNKISKRTQDVQ